LIKVHTIGDIVAKGTGIGKRAANGRVVVGHDPKELLDKVKPGDVLVTRMTDADFVPILERCSAIITEEGGLTSHAAVVGLSLGIPVIVGVERATEVLRDQESVTVDVVRGLIYKGIAQVL
jgi:pyruvate kinase